MSSESPSEGLRERGVGMGGQMDTLVDCRGPSIQKLLLGWTRPW